MVHWRLCRLPIRPCVLDSCPPRLHRRGNRVPRNQMGPALVRCTSKILRFVLRLDSPWENTLRGAGKAVGMGRRVLLWGYYEFAEHGRETQDVSAGRTHRSAPTAKGKDGRNLSDAFCQFNALYLDDKWCIPRKRRRVCLCTTLVSHRRGGPMCPPVVGI